jgi:hypothetical protein
MTGFCREAARQNSQVFRPGYGCYQMRPEMAPERYSILGGLSSQATNVGAQIKLRYDTEPTLFSDATFRVYPTTPLTQAWSPGLFYVAASRQDPASIYPSGTEELRFAKGRRCLKSGGSLRKNPP